MKSGNKAGSWLLVVLLTAAAINEIIPPQGTPLLNQFQQSASPDESNQATLDTILSDAREMEEASPGRSYANLFDAIGTNDIRSLFLSLIHI